MVIGVTRAVASLMAALVAWINSLNGINSGFLNTPIYNNSAAFRDIVLGNNDTLSNGQGYQAGPGWDACTGLGVSDGKKISAIFNKTVKKSSIAVNRLNPKGMNEFP
jgi:kumamolisin